MTTKCPTGYHPAAHENQSCNCAQEPTHDFTDRAFYDAVWTILVEHAGAYDDPKSMERETFIRSFCALKYPTTEYRFGGLLGFGGKFWRSYYGFYVNCYREDETPKMKAVMEKVNDLIQQAVAQYKPRMRG